MDFTRLAQPALAEALTILDYRVHHSFDVVHTMSTQERKERALELARQHDAFADNPWPILYQDLDKAYPNSKFILTIRDSESWIESVLNHFGGKSSPMREWIYGVGNPIDNEDIYIKRFEQHNQEVIEYFKGRPQDLLVMDLAQGNGWDELCSFLEKDKVENDFPKLNAKVNQLSEYTESLSL